MPLVDAFLRKHYEDKETFAELSAHPPVGRMWKPEEVPAMCLHLASGESAFVTGAEFT